MSLIPSQSVNEKSISLEAPNADVITASASVTSRKSTPDDSAGASSFEDLAMLTHNIRLRNTCLDLLLDLLTTSSANGTL